MAQNLKIAAGFAAFFGAYGALLWAMIWVVWKIVVFGPVFIE
jgi:hypothetical protein